MNVPIVAPAKLHDAAVRGVTVSCPRHSHDLSGPAGSCPSLPAASTGYQRGGQQIYAQGGDLVVVSSVSPGAELLADGNIHVYGPMRGRALAGIKGDTKARIFCQQLTAELVSIAGQYKVSEDLRRDPLWGASVQVNLSGDVLNIIRL